MSKFFTFTGLIIIGVALIVALAVTNKSYASLGTSEGAYTPQTPMPTVLPLNVSPDPMARAKGRAQSPITGSEAIAPPVTEATVREYLAHNYSVKGVKSQNVNVEKVQFITVNELKPLLNNDPFMNSLPSTEVLVYVTMTGDFTPPPAEGGQAFTADFHSMYQVFDAVTGNQIMGGIK